MAESKDDPHSQSYIELGKLVCSNPGALGIAIIIANDYDNKKCKELKIKKIEGPFKDAQKAELVFRSFHTICYTLVNRTAQQTMQALLAAASYPYPDTYKWIVFIFSGHGQSELALYAQDGNTISIQVIIDLFQPKSTPQNGNIPKLFFIDACRGNEETETVLVPRGETDGVPIPREGKTLETLRLPSKCNTLVGYSTLPHKIAYEADNGGLWMSFLLERLEQQDNSVVEILTEVNGDVVQHYQDVEGKMQAPEYRSTLLQNVWFKKEVEVRGKKDSITPLEHPSIPDPSWLDGISFTQKLNQLCKKSVLKDRKYTDQQGDGYHVILIITLTDGTDMEFNSSTIKLCFDCINDAREAVARHAVEFLQQNPIVTPPIHPTPSPTSPTPTTMPSTHDPITKLTSRGKGLPPLKKCVEELKNFIVDKKRLEAPCYIEIPVDGEQQFRCSVKHQLFGEIIGDLQRSKKDAKQSAAKKALEHLQAKGLL